MERASFALGVYSVLSPTVYNYKTRYEKEYSQTNNKKGQCRNHQSSRKCTFEISYLLPTIAPPPPTPTPQHS